MRQVPARLDPRHELPGERGGGGARANEDRDVEREEPGAVGFIRRSAAQCRTFTLGAYW